MQAIAPAYVSTKMTKYVPPTVSAPTPSTYAQAAVRHIGYEAHAVPWFKHAMDRCVIFFRLFFFFSYLFHRFDWFWEHCVEIFVTQNSMGGSILQFLRLVCD